VSDAGPRVWGLLGDRTGDNNQVLALCEALGVPFETRTLRYNLLRAIAGKYLGATLATLKRSCRSHVAPPWPDVVISIGRRSVPVARWIRKASGGRTRLVLLGHPRVDPAIFDLVITTRQYPVPRHGNVILLPMSMTRYRELPEPDAGEAALLSALPRPHLLMAVGGPTKYWALDDQVIRDAVEQLCRRAQQIGGTLIAVGSPRTDSSVIDALRSHICDHSSAIFVEGSSPRFPVLLRDADRIFVTGDSISMLSEAIQTGKPVGMIAISQNAKGKRNLGPSPDVSSASHRRDLRRYWNHLQDQGLIGTLDEPVAGQFENPTEIAREAVLRLLDRGPGLQR